MKPKTIKIPYNYQKNSGVKYFTLDDLNKGATLCRKLGFQVIKVIVGKKEWEQIKNWTYIGAPEKPYLTLPWEFIRSRKENNLVFVCKESKI